METILSPSGKFKAIFSRNENRVLKLIQIFRIGETAADDTLIYEYETMIARQPFSDFVVLNGQEWWFGGRHYLLRLMLNCETGYCYDEKKIDDQDSWRFIWLELCAFSPNGKYILVGGCIWACPYEHRLYDISDLSGNGIVEIDCVDDDDRNYVYEFNSENNLEIYYQNRYVETIFTERNKPSEEEKEI